MAGVSSSLRRSWEVRRWALRWALLVGVALVAINLIWRDDPRDRLRLADRLLAEGSYYAALQHYAPLSVDFPDGQAALRLGIVRFLRGEHTEAERALLSAVRQGLPPTEAGLVLLYRGQLAMLAGDLAEAQRLWQLLLACAAPQPCAWQAEALLLQAEAALLDRDYQAAQTFFTQALAQGLPAEWQTRAHFRIALLAAYDQSAVAQAWLAEPITGASQSPLVAPLLPPLAYDRAALESALARPADQLPLNLGQLYSGLGLHELAAEQFAKVAPSDPAYTFASASAAYARWLAGERALSLTQLEALAFANPTDQRIAALFTVALNTSDPLNAPEQLARLDQRRPETSLAWANWHLNQRDYLAAVEAFRRAISQAPPGEQGRYARLAAEFHLQTGYELCAGGLTFAEQALAREPNEPATLSVAVALRYRCGEQTQAEAAARTLLEQRFDAQAAYYLARILAERGETQAANRLLIEIIDREPAGPWRAPAEHELR